VKTVAALLFQKGEYHMAMTASIGTGLVAIDFTNSTFIAYGTIAVSGNYGSASSHGDTLDLSALGAPSGQPPLEVKIWESQSPGTSQSGWLFMYNTGTTQANGNVQMFGTGTASGDALNEYSEGSAYSSATPAAPTKLYFRAVFPKL
jgi:hypothetical protein